MAWKLLCSIARAYGRNLRKNCCAFCLVVGVLVCAAALWNGQQLQNERRPQVREVEDSRAILVVPPIQTTRVYVRQNTSEGGVLKTDYGYTTPVTNVTVSVNSVVIDTVPEHCQWVSRTKEGPPYYLTALVMLRIYKEDKANLTTREMKQWLEYMRYIGVEHVYLYDVYVTENESQWNELEPFFQDNYVTYTDWHMYNPHTVKHTKVPGYQDCLDRFGHESTWQTAIDIDEYPFSPTDTEPGFLKRFIERYSSKNPTVSEICMENFLFLGKEDFNTELLIERLWRRDPKPSNTLVKPIYKPGNIKASMHHNRVLKGISRSAPYTELRMNHYWGARLQNWGDDTPQILQRTIEDRSMEAIVNAFKECMLYRTPYL